MMKRLLLMCACSCFSFSVPLMAAENLSFELMARAVINATQADVYNQFCEKESAIADQFLEKFKAMETVPEKEYNALVTLRDKNITDTNRKIKESGRSCKDVEIMISRLQIMRELKDVSYLLNGVDPATLPPDPMPDLETLLPARSDPMPVLPPAEL